MYRGARRIEKKEEKGTQLNMLPRYKEYEDFTPGEGETLCQITVFTVVREVCVRVVVKWAWF